jgi:hypothetical protein
MSKARVQNWVLVAGWIERHIGRWCFLRLFGDFSLHLEVAATLDTRIL